MSSVGSPTGGAQGPSQSTSMLATTSMGEGGGAGRHAAVQDWYHQSWKNIANARRTQSNALEQYKTSINSHATTRKGNLEHYRNIQLNLEQKADQTEKLNRKLHGKSTNLRLAVASTEDILNALVKERSTAGPALELNLWRQSEREKRPEKEVIHDSVQLALIQEEALLRGSGTKLDAQISRTEAMAKDLSETLQAMETGKHEQAESLKIDRKRLIASQRTWPIEQENGPGIPRASPRKNNPGMSGARAMKIPSSKTGQQTFARMVVPTGGFASVSSSVNALASKSPRGNSVGTTRMKVAGGAVMLPMINSSGAPPPNASPNQPRPPSFRTKTPDKDGDNLGEGLGDDDDSIKLGESSEEGGTYLGGTTPDASNTDMPMGEVEVQGHLRRVVIHAGNLEHSSQEVRDESEALLLKIFKESRSARLRVEKSLTNRIQSIKGLCLKLQNAEEETLFAISKLEHCEALTAEHIERQQVVLVDQLFVLDGMTGVGIGSAGEPMEPDVDGGAAAAAAEERQERQLKIAQTRRAGGKSAKKAAMEDPVQAALDGHALGVEVSVRQLAMCQNYEHLNIECLHEALHSLREDLDRKRCAREIDERCKNRQTMLDENLDGQQRSPAMGEDGTNASYFPGAEASFQ